MLFEVGIPIWCMDSSWDGGVVHTILWSLTLTLTSDLIFTFFPVWSISYITNNFPQMCLILDQFLLRGWGAFVMLLCHVYLLNIKYVSTVKCLSISFLYIHNLRLSHFSIKRLQSSYAVMRRLLFEN